MSEIDKRFNTYDFGQLRCFDLRGTEKEMIKIKHALKLQELVKKKLKQYTPCDGEWYNFTMSDLQSLLDASKKPTKISGVIHDKTLF